CLPSLLCQSASGFPGAVRRRDVYGGQLRSDTFLYALGISHRASLLETENKGGRIAHSSRLRLAPVLENLSAARSIRAVADTHLHRAGRGLVIRLDGGQ